MHHFRHFSSKVLKPALAGLIFINADQIHPGEWVVGVFGLYQGRGIYHLCIWRG